MAGVSREIHLAVNVFLDIGMNATSFPVRKIFSGERHANLNVQEGKMRHAMAMEFVCHIKFDKDIDHQCT